LKATYYALANTYKYLTPDFWGKPQDLELPTEEHSVFLHTKVAAKTAPERRERREKSDRPPREHREHRENAEGRVPRGDRRSGRPDKTEAPAADSTPAPVAE